MPISLIHGIRTICAAALAQAFVFSSNGADLEIVAAQYMADQQFPQFQVYWAKDSSPNPAKVQPETVALGGAIHIYLRNRDSQAVDIQDVVLGNICLSEAIAETAQRKFKGHLHANNIYFSKLLASQKERLRALGEPVWWRAQPRKLAPRAIAEILIRLRMSAPKSSISCVVKLGDGSSKQLSVATADVGERCVDVCFSKSLDRAWLYFASRKRGRVPKQILVDGQDVTAQCTIGTDPQLKLTPVDYKPSEPFAPAALHCFQAIYEDGATAIAAIRAFPSVFAYGIWGAKPGNEGEIEVGRAFIKELQAHNVNLQMPGVGSRAVSAFYKSQEGRVLLQAAGIRRVVDAIGKGNTEHPYAYYLADEPDAADSRVQGLPGGRQVGSLAQGLVAWSEELRSQDPVTPHMLNVDFTFVPHNWYVYGQLPDIFAADPYYQPRLRQAYARSRERIRLFGKATVVFAESAICKAACEPRPLHIILYANRYEKGSDRFRGPTPQEKRIEAFYAVGAGAKGLSYWWYSPARPAVGLGAAEPDARALWREVGLLGAEFRTAGDLIARSTPLASAVTATSNLWVKTLAAGLDALVLTVVNEDYTNDSRGTKLTPVLKAVVRLVPPAWMKAQDIFEISSRGTKALAWRAKGPEITLELGPLDVTRLVVISSNLALRPKLQEEYESHYASRVTRLLSP